MAKNRSDRSNEIRTTLITDNDLKQNNSERVNQALEGIQKDAPNYVNDNITPNNATGAVGYTVEPAALGQLDWVTNKFIQDNYALNLSAAIIMKYTISSWTAEDSDNSGEEDGFYYSDIDITDVFEDQNLLFGYTADLGDGLEIVGADKAIFIDANTVRIRRYGDDSLNVIIAGTSDLGSVIDAGVNSNIPPYKNYLYLDTDATGSVGVRSTRMPYATLAAAKAAYEAGDIIAVEKLETTDPIIEVGQSIRYEAIDDRKIISLENETLIDLTATGGEYSLDLNAGLLITPTDQVFLLGENNTITNEADLSISAKEAQGQLAIRLYGCGADIDIKNFSLDAVNESDLGFFTQIQFNNPFALKSAGEFYKKKIHFDNCIIGSDLATFTDVRGFGLRWTGIDAADNHWIEVSGNYKRSFNINNDTFGWSLIQPRGGLILGDGFVEDLNYEGPIISNSNFDALNVMVNGSFVSKGGGDLFNNESQVSFTGTGIIIHNGEIIYNGSNPNIFV